MPQIADLARPQDAANHLLRQSFASATRQPERFAPAFYKRLFELAPGVRHLFPEELKHQQQKLTQALAMLVRSLDRPAELEPVLRKLGERHVSYGSEASHYAVVGEALIDTLDHLAEQPLDSETRAAWQRLYGWVAATMLAGAEQASMPLVQAQGG
jgi:hemoglobin-like flavoprotein